MRRITVRCLAVSMLTGMMALAGCSKGEANTSGQPTKVKIALNWVPEPEFGGIYAARQTGAFARHGLDVQIEPGGSGSPVIQRVAAGQVEFGIASADEVLMARARGADVVAIFATYQTCPQGIMVHRSRGLNEIGQVFKSGTVAIEPGLPYANYLKNRYGFENVKIVPYDGGVARFIADKDYAQQCFITSEPIAARRAGADPQVFLIADVGYNPYTAVVVTRGEVVRHKPELVKSLAIALREGWRTYLEDPTSTNATMQLLNKTMDPATFAAAAEAQKSLIPSDDTPAGRIGSMIAQRWETLARQLVDVKVIDHAPAANECFVDIGQ